MSKPDAWMPLWIGDYRKDTTRLTLEQHGAYLTLLMDYWVNGAPPNDDATICRILGVERRVWARLKPVILPFFDISGANLRHKRVEIELSGALERSGKNAARAKVAAEARWAKERNQDNGIGQSSDEIGKLEADAPSNAPSIAPGMLQAMLEECPPPVTYSSPTEKASGTPHETGDQEAWRRGVALLRDAGGLPDRAARKLFGRLLKDHALEPRDLLPSIVKAETLGTKEPQAYLIQVARVLASRKGGAAQSAVAMVEGWGVDEWRIAVRRFVDAGSWGASMGPAPGEVGCIVPAAVLGEFEIGGKVVHLSRGAAA